jgi:TetR/AcrR family transcriptional regulator, transcriptional repressor for nem operon
MSKARATKERILKQAAELFNQQGYAGASMSDIMQATGLQKGGIYNHFPSKQALALAAFDFAVQLTSQRYGKAMKGKRHAIERLHAILSVFQSYLDDPPLAGGCPLLNTAVDSDDTDPILCDRARQAMDAFQSMISKIVSLGISRQEIRSTIDADVVATIITAMFEGAMMISKLYDDPVHLHRSIAHLADYIDNSLSV